MASMDVGDHSGHRCVGPVLVDLLLADYPYSAEAVGSWRGAGVVVAVDSGK